VTPTSSGIGYELAKLPAKGGKNLIIVSRDRNRLEEIRPEVENECKPGQNLVSLR